MCCKCGAATQPAPGNGCTCKKDIVPFNPLTFFGVNKGQWELCYEDGRPFEEKHVHLRVDNGNAPNLKMRRKKQKVLVEIVICRLANGNFVSYSTATGKDLVSAYPNAVAYREIEIEV